MFKIRQWVGQNGAPIQKYSLQRFTFDPETRTNREMYTVIGVDKQRLMRLLQKEGVATCVVLRMSGQPVILTDSGDITTTTWS
ncbi:MAG: hypothetical protein NVS1B10_08380 [Candidatus Saccharimonadales bacterium]